jgi:hypothetical protein
MHCPDRLRDVEGVMVSVSIRAVLTPGVALAAVGAVALDSTSLSLSTRALPSSPAAAQDPRATLLLK